MEEKRKENSQEVSKNDIELEKVLQDADTYRLIFTFIWSLILVFILCRTVHNLTEVLTETDCSKDHIEHEYEGNDL